MAATFSFNQRNGAAAGVSTDLGASGTLWAYKNIDTSGTVDYVTNPITRTNNSYEVYVSGHFSGTYNAVTNIKFYGVSQTPGSAGISMYAGSWASGGYAAATQITSTRATALIPTASAAGVDISNNAALVTNANAFSNFAVIQMRTDANAPVGDVAAAQLAATISYDEN